MAPEITSPPIQPGTAESDPTLGVLLPALERVRAQHAELTDALSDPAVVRDQRRFRELTREHARLSAIVHLGAEYGHIRAQLNEALELAASDDDELVTLAKAELPALTQRETALRAELEEALVPPDQDENRDAIVEIRAGTGGEEAGLFAADLYRMYTRYAERRGWRAENLASSPNSSGGFKEIIFSVQGEGAYGHLHHDSGVHRVQRVPVTEASGRIHTSAASVVVLPEADEVDVNIASEDLRIDVFRSSGPGGQSVNTTDSAVRITHLPTGLVVSCQDEKSQHKNRSKAMKVLRARLLDHARAEAAQKVSDKRRQMVRHGDRSEKIRTYNFPQERVTDHRIKLTLHRLSAVLDGELDLLIEPLRTHNRAQRVVASEAGT
jgi:peptide chain release factor 1